MLKPSKSSKIVSKPQVKGTTFALPTPGGTSDPTITGGSILWCRFDVPGACQAFALPAVNWEGLGKPAGSKGYRYKGAGSSSDPCKSIVIKEKVIKAFCKREDLSTPIGAGGVGVEIALGTDRYCAESSAATLATVKKNHAKTWKAIKANAPAACPAPVPFCGNGVVDPGENCDGADLGDNQTCEDVYGGYNPDFGTDACLAGNTLTCGADCQYDGTLCACTCEEDFDCLLPEGFLLDCGPTYCVSTSNGGICAPLDVSDCECAMGDQGDIDGVCLGSNLDTGTLGLCLVNPFDPGENDSELEDLCLGFDGADPDFPRCDYCDF